MEQINGYYGSYNETGKHIDYIRYGLLNEFGYNINRKERECYNEDKIIKKTCNMKNHKNK